MQTMKRKRTYLSLQERVAYRRLEEVVGCKWSSAVVAAIGRGVRRPGALVRYIPGISKKVLQERLRKLLAYGLVTRTEFNTDKLPHVEYRLTRAGAKLAAMLEKLRALQQELDATGR
jgi:DNA-binding HxlR family transcriptional regulator